MTAPDDRPAMSDAAARRLAQTRFDVPIVLAAGAGTGKTATLVARIAAWCTGPGWDRAARRLDEEARSRGRRDQVTDQAVASRTLDGVLAVTFTDAAAAEMAAKTATALATLARGEWPVGCDPAAFATAEAIRRDRARSLLVTLDRLRVATIHATCRRLLADWPLEAGLDPAFTVDAEGEALDAVIAEAIDEALAQGLGATPDEHLLALLRAGVGPEEIADSLSTLIRAGATPDALEGDGYAANEVAELVREVRGAAAVLHSMLAPALPPPGTRTSVPHDVAAHLAALLDRVAETETDSARLELVTGEVFPERLRKRLADWRRGSFKANETEWFGSSAGSLGAAAGALVELLTFTSRLDAALFGHARAFLAPLLDTVIRTLRRRGIATFEALLANAAALLRDHPAVAERERTRLDQLLVDEFQDTDPLQCELVRALALSGPPSERPGLFLVGDPKQSIYGWRNADLASYLAFVGEVDAAGGVVAQLDVNFRSVEPILAEVARAIAPVMVENASVQPPFVPLQVCAERAESPGHRDDTRSPVEYWVPWARARVDGATISETSTGETLDIEARAAARDIADVHDRHGVDWARFAILLRTSSELERVSSALRDAGVPFAVERDRGYFRRREIIDAAALIRTLLDPADQLALVTWLRSCVVGVPDAALLPLWRHHLLELAAALGGDTGDALAQATAAAQAAAIEVPEVPGLDRVRGWEQTLIAAFGDIDVLRRSARSRPPVEFVKEVRARTLIEAGEAARRHGAARLANLDRFFRRLTTSLDAGAGTQDTLGMLRRAIAEERDAEEARLPEAARNAVRVMTIHKAKGLDFDHVYLLQTCHKTRGNSTAGSGAARVAGEWALKLAGVPAPPWRRIEARDRIVAEAERVRTLYVAMTRARDRLVVSGLGIRDGDGSLSRLLAHRAGAIDLDSAFAAAAASGAASVVDADGVRWVFPVLDPTPPRPRAAAAVVLPDQAEIRRNVARNAAARSFADAHMARAWSATASAAAHERLPAIGGEDDEDDLRTAAADPADERARRIATTVGSAIHQALEGWIGPVDAALQAARTVVDRFLWSRLAGAELRDARDRAATLLDSFAAGSLGVRLAELAPRVIARELPVLLPPGTDSGSPVGAWIGTVDLVYRDRDDGAVVVADFKTDRVGDETEIAERAATYLPQLALYGRAVAEALALESGPRLEVWFVAAGRIVVVATPATR